VQQQLRRAVARGPRTGTGHRPVQTLPPPPLHHLRRNAVCDEIAGIPEVVVCSRVRGAKLSTIEQPRSTRTSTTAFSFARRTQGLAGSPSNQIRLLALSLSEFDNTARCYLLGRSADDCVLCPRASRDSHQGAAIPEAFHHPYSQFPNCPHDVAAS